MINKKVAVIGLGFVGKALLNSFNENTKSESYIVDIHNKENYLNELQNKDIVFICLPTPTKDGKCDDSLIINYVDELKFFNGEIVIKSTIPVETIKKIKKLNSKIILWPELLREKFANEDMISPTLIVIGTDSQDSFIKIENFIKNQTEIKYIKDNKLIVNHVTPEEASIFKYSVNSFLATKVLFMHQIYQWLEVRNESDSWQTVSKLLAQEGRIGSTHLVAPGEHGLGFGGSCFPKDVEALIEQTTVDGYDFTLLKKVLEDNSKIKNHQNKSIIDD